MLWKQKVGWVGFLTAANGALMRPWGIIKTGPLLARGPLWFRIVLLESSRWDRNSDWLYRVTSGHLTKPLCPGLHSKTAKKRESPRIHSLSSIYFEASKLKYIFLLRRNIFLYPFHPAVLFIIQGLPLVCFYCIYLEAFLSLSFSPPLKSCQQFPAMSIFPLPNILMLPRLVHVTICFELILTLQVSVCSETMIYEEEKI